LDVLDELTAHGPVGEDHLALHRARDACARVIENRDDALEQFTHVAVTHSHGRGRRALRQVLPRHRQPPRLAAFHITLQTRGASTN